MPETLANGASSTLNGAITNSQTTLPIQSADVSKFPSSGTFRIAVSDGTNTELMTVTGGQGTATLTVTRASEAYAGAATAFAFASGSTVAQVLTSAGLVAAVAVVGDHSVNAYHSATVTIPSGTFTIVALDSAHYDTDGFHSLTVNNSRLTVPSGLAGKYLIQAQVAWGSTSASGFRDLEIQLNGTTTIAQVQVTSITGGGEYAQAVSRLWQFNAGDYVQMGVAHNGGTGVTINADASKSPEFSMIKVA